MLLQLFLCLLENFLFGEECSKFSHFGRVSSIGAYTGRCVALCRPDVYPRRAATDCITEFSAVRVEAGAISIGAIFFVELMIFFLTRFDGAAVVAPVAMVGARIEF